MVRRKQITYDIDTKVAEKIFGSGYRKIYLYIEMSLEKAGFTHIQGSVFQSDLPMNKIRVSIIINDIIKNCSGLEKCVRDIRMTDIMAENSLNYLADYDGTIGRYLDISPRNKTRDDYTR